MKLYKCQNKYLQLIDRIMEYTDKNPNTTISIFIIFCIFFIVIILLTNYLIKS